MWAWWLGRYAGSVRVFIAAALAAVVAVLAACTSAVNGTDSSVPPSPSVRVPPASALATVPDNPAAQPQRVSSAPVARKPVNHCATNTADQLVLVSVRAQRMWLCHRRTTVRANPITTGMLGQYTETPTGHYRIEGRTRHTVLTLNTGAQYSVQYWIPFDAPLFGFHDSSWQDFPYGSPTYKTQGSHGCIHMPLKAIAFLYRWADIGAEVRIA